MEDPGALADPDLSMSTAFQYSQPDASLGQPHSPPEALEFPHHLRLDQQLGLLPPEPHLSGSYVAEHQRGLDSQHTHDAQHAQHAHHNQHATSGQYPQHSQPVDLQPHQQHSYEYQQQSPAQQVHQHAEQADYQQQMVYHQHLEGSKQPGHHYEAHQALPDGVVLGLDPAYAQRPEVRT